MNSLKIDDALELDINTWFTERAVKDNPIHFVKADTPLNHSSLIWVLETLKGRYYIGEERSINDLFGFNTVSYIYFEDPTEAMYFDLRWS